MAEMYYGPSSFDAAMDAALSYAPLYKPPVGLDGLKADEARQVANWCLEVPIEGRASLVVGPMDAVRQGSSDALLKTLEEDSESKIQIFLWAQDIGEVSSTIKSRCDLIWSYGPEERSEFAEVGMRVLGAVRSRQFDEVVIELENTKGSEREILDALVASISKSITDDPGLIPLWERLRVILQNRTKVFPAMILSAVMEDG